MPKVVFTRPDYEIVTHYLFVWSQKLVSEAKKNKWTVTDLRKSQATIAKFTAAVGKTSPALILLHGHGNYSSISGHNGKVIIQAGQNENILKNAVTYAFSCQTAKELGTAAVEAGAKSYIGYNEDFIFFQTEGMEKSPASDKRAAKFMEPALEVSSSLLQKKSAKKAWRNSQKAFKKNIDALISSNSKEVYLVRYLLWDKNHQVCLIKNSKTAAIDT